MAIEETTVEVDGVPLVVRDDGEDRGRPFVWAHGLTSSMAHEDALAVFGWSAPGVRLVRYDAPGHGRSGGPPDAAAYRWDRLGETMASLMDGLGIGRAVVGGASMGCGTVLHLACRAPERVEALVLAIPPTAWEVRAPRAHLYEEGAVLVEREGSGALAELTTAVPAPAVLGARSEEMTAASAAAVAAMDPAVLPHVLRGASRSDLPPLGDLARIAVPTLIVAWDTDAGHPRSTAEALARTIPGAELHVAGDLDAIGTWPALVEAFLARLT